MILKMMLIAGGSLVLSTAAYAGDVVPTDIMQPGTQPQEVGALESADKCDNCHGGYNQAVEPAFNFRGSMMAQAGRDPLFWATLAVAEQDFDGVGDLCLRCHAPEGWLAGRSTPTDGSGLAASDSGGVTCDLCHTMTNADGSEHAGVQNAPFLAYDETTGEGYYGSGMYALWGGSEKMGPYIDAQARHQFMKSDFHRSNDFCGTCHDVSNAVVGDLAHNAGAQPTGDPVIQSGVPGSAVDGKAAFNNPPYMYGVVERTFSEFKSGLWGEIPVSAYDTLPADLKGGAAEAAYLSAMATGGDYADTTTRYFNCQTCHMRPVNGAGCNKNGAPIRPDLPLHDMTGGNYWVYDAIKYLDSFGLLRLGGGISPEEGLAMDEGKARAMKQLTQAATLIVDDSALTVKIVNHSGHKLITGYPEGRRMWLNIKWYDANETLIREDGEYGDLLVTLDGVPTTVQTILDDSNTKIYEAHYGITSEWANQLLGLGYDPNLPVEYDRVTGVVDHTLGDVAALPSGEAEETFHFALNNAVIKDNRIPPYGFRYDMARERNALPVPPDQYGNPGPGGTYNYFDVFQMEMPAGATYATIDLLYQPTSWEYIQFLYLANVLPPGDFLANEGAYLLEAWMNTGMAAPYVMASAIWGTPPQPQVLNVRTQAVTTWCMGKRNEFLTQCDTFTSRDTVGIIAHVVDDDWQPLSGSQVFFEVLGPSGTAVGSLQGFSDANGDASTTWKPGRRDPAGQYTINVVNILHEGRQFDAGAGVTSATFFVQ